MKTSARMPYSSSRGWERAILYHTKSIAPYFAVFQNDCGGERRMTCIYVREEICRPICRPVGSIGEHVIRFVCIGLLSDTSPSSLINLSVNSSISSILSSILSSIRCYFIIYKIHHIKSGRLGRARDAGSWREPTRILTLSRQF